MALWRCQNLGCSEDPHGRLIFDFENDSGECPKCGSRRGDPRTGHYVQKRETIHFEAAHHKIAGLGVGHAACTPGKKTAGRKTGYAGAVTCPACRETAEWKQAMEESGEVVAAHDFGVEIDTKQQVIRNC